MNDDIDVLKPDTIAKPKIEQPRTLQGRADQ